MSEEPEPGGEQDGAGGSRVDAALAIYLKDSSLWPVLIAGIATFTTLGAWLVWMVWVGRNPFGGAALLLLLGMSVDLWVRDLRARRFGATSWIVLGWWVVCVGAATTVVAAA